MSLSKETNRNNLFSKTSNLILIRQSDKAFQGIVVNWTELGTLEWETFNPDCLIRIFNVDTFNFLFNPLFFGYSREKSKTGFSKLESTLPIWGQNFKFPGF